MQQMQLIEIFLFLLQHTVLGAGCSRIAVVLTSTYLSVVQEQQLIGLIGNILYKVCEHSLPSFTKLASAITNEKTLDYIKATACLI